MFRVTIVYVSRTTDKEIIAECGLLEKLEPGDSIMANRGFPIQDLLQDCDADLTIPPFINIRERQMSVESEQMTRDIASKFLCNCCVLKIK